METQECKNLGPYYEIINAYPFKQDVYTNRDPRNGIIDEEPRAFYWYQYRRTYQLLKPCLTLHQPVKPQLPVIIIGRSELKPTDLDLTKADREPIGGFIFPGISMHIAFTDNCYAACGAIFDRLKRQGEHLFFLPDTKKLLETGYTPYYVPTPNLPLHLRIVHKGHLKDPDLHMVPFLARKSLAEYLKEFKVC